MNLIIAVYFQIKALFTALFWERKMQKKKTKKVSDI